MNTRRWTIAGCAVGLFSIILLTALFALAYGADLKGSPRFTVFVIVDILSGFASMTLCAAASIVRAFKREGNKYVKGVKDTVDRLAEALPGSNVRRIS